MIKKYIIQRFDSLGSRKWSDEEVCDNLNQAHNCLWKLSMAEHQTYHNIPEELDGFRLKIVEIDEELNQNVLDCPMEPNDSGARTVKGYLLALLDRVWSEGERFSGKRAFGNSDWQYEVYEALVRGGLMEGTFAPEDDGGYLEDYDWLIGDKLILDAIRSLNG